MSSMQLIERAFAVLNVVAHAGEGVTLTQVAKQAHLPKTTAFRLLATLEQLEAVERVDAGRGYKIGRTILALAAQSPHAENLAAIAQPYLQELHEALGETVALTLPESDNAYVVAQITSQHAIQVRDWTGERIPMYVQSTGRVFLAARSAEALERYLARPLMAYTKKTICEPEAMRQMLAQVAAQGYAWVFEEFEEGLVAVAAPVRDQSGKVVAAVNAFGPGFRFPGQGQQERVTHLVVDMAQRLSEQLRMRSFQ